MPKQLTFEKRYPTLRKPLNSRENLESHVTLRKKACISLQPTSNLLNEANLTDTLKYIASNTIMSTSKSTNHEINFQDYSNDQENIFEETSQDINMDNVEDIRLEDFSLQSSRPILPAVSSASQNSHDEVYEVS